MGQQTDLEEGPRIVVGSVFIPGPTSAIGVAMTAQLLRSARAPRFHKRHR